jgi:sugar lactone lactonase YvrE
MFLSTRAIVCLLVAFAGAGGSIAGTCCHAAELEYPLSVAVASNGDLFLADRKLPGVWKIAGGKLSLYFQASKKLRTTLNAVRCVRLDHEGKLLAGDSATRNVYRFDDEGRPHPITKTINGMGLIGIPMDIAVNSKGDVYVSDLEIQRVVKIPHGSDQPEEVAEISGCRGLFIDKEDTLWVISTTEDQLYRITADGKQTIVVKGRPFGFPHTVVVASDGTAYVCDGYAKTIWKIAADGKPVALVVGKPLLNPVGMAIKDDVLYVSDPHAKSVFTVDSAGKITKVGFQADD